MARPTIANIDLNALRHNYVQAKNCTQGSKAVAVVKANAYGHGAVECAKALSLDADAFGVACIEEAIELRAAGINNPVLLLEGPFSEDEVAVAVQQNFWLMVSNTTQIDWLCNNSAAHQLSVWLKVDTGMHRLGLEPGLVSQCWQRLLAAGVLPDNMVLASHFASADDPASAMTKRQMEILKPLSDQLKCRTSSANSAGIIAWPHSHGDWIRPGFMLYGNTPMIDDQPRGPKLKPVMTLRSAVIGLRQVNTGDTVGYGEAWTAARPSTIATIAIGYGDGYPRMAANGTPVLVNGCKATLAGRVSMDMITVDVTDIDGVALGDEVELWGSTYSANDIASHSQTIGYELLTRMPLRVPRIYTE